MSNPIGAGTAQITYNSPEGEAVILSRLAFEMNISRGELLRDIVLRGLQSMSAEAANQIHAIRAERLRMKHGIVCLFVGLLAIGSAALSGADMRRSPRGRRIEIEEAA